VNEKNLELLPYIDKEKPEQFHIILKKCNYKVFIYLNKKSGMKDPLNIEWQNITQFLYTQFGLDDDLAAILLFIGIQELGKGFKKYTKQEKTDLIHIGTCKVLSYDGYYRFKTLDRDQWPVYIRNKPLPKFSVLEQENLLKRGIINYFKGNSLI